MSEIDIKIKDQFVLENCFYACWHDILIDLFTWLINTGLVPKITITSAYRPGDKGVHGQDPLRGVDIRSSGFDAKSIVDKINNHWQYDSKRPKMMCAILHNVGSGEHIHLQVHDSTTIVRGGW